MCFYNHCCSEEAVSITYSAFVSVALSIKYAMRTRHIVICDLSRSKIVSHILSHKQYDFRKEEVIEPKICVFIFSTTLCKKNLILRINERDIIINLHRSSCKVTRFFFVRL